MAEDRGRGALRRASDPEPISEADSNQGGEESPTKRLEEKEKNAENGNLDECESATDTSVEPSTKSSSLSHPESESQGDSEESRSVKTIKPETTVGGGDEREEEEAAGTVAHDHTQDGHAEEHTDKEEVTQTAASPSQHDAQADHADGPDEAAPDDAPPPGQPPAPPAGVKQEEPRGESIRVESIRVESIRFGAHERGGAPPPCPVEQKPPLPPNDPVPGPGERPAGSRLYLMAAVLVLGAVLWQQLRPQSAPPQDTVQQRVDVFLRRLDELQAGFPSQRVELWNRGRIHLQRHLQTARPTEPVSLILTAGLGAHRTLRCLAEGLAAAFSSALNASVLPLDGAGAAGKDSDQVKLDIDRALQEAFEGDRSVAVIHRLEELPPGSTLIFYRYCDHENAAYKNAFLIFTVLLGEQAIPAEAHLSAVEEMVDDQLQRKFLSDGQPASFDRMDRDKYGGLWSRISHLILPVAAEDSVERGGCERASAAVHF